MDVVIVAELAGASQIGRGQTSWASCDGQERLSHGSTAITRDVLAALQGASLAGAESFTVIDALYPGVRGEELPEGCTLFVRDRLLEVFSSMEGENRRCCLFLVGFRARAGTSNALFPRTFPGVSEIILDGRGVGEIGVLSELGKFFGMPLALVTGDQAAIDEARKVSNTCTTAVVKRRVGDRELLLSPDQSTIIIRAAAELAIKRALCMKTPRDSSTKNVRVRFTRAGMPELQLSNVLITDVYKTLVAARMQQEHMD